MGGPNKVVIAEFRERDLRRLHVLLMCYESPYTLPNEEAQRAIDEQEHERLRREIEQVIG